MYYTAAQKRAYARKKAAARRRAAISQAPRRSYVTGRGDYKVVKKAPPRRRWSAPKTFGAIGGTVGSALGEAIAPGIGGFLGSHLGNIGGNLLGRGFRSITGWGDYTVRSNSFIHNVDVPIFGDSTIRLRHKEYIGSVNATQAFALASYPINPGMSNVFPWCSAIAASYEQWMPLGMVFCFVSTSTNGITSSDASAGKIGLATEYNSADPNFINFQQMMGTTFSSIGKPQVDIMHAIECDPHQTPMKWYYVRTGAAPANTDIRLYDLGNFQIASEGSQADFQAGDLWVTYDILLQKPQMNNIIGLNLLSDHFQVSSGVDISGHYFGTSDPLPAKDGSNLGCIVAPDTIQFPDFAQPGMVFKIDYTAEGNDPVSLNDPTLTLTGCSLKAATYDGVVTNRKTNEGQTGGVYLDSFFVVITGTNPAVTFSGGTLPVTSCGMDLYITQVPSDLE